MSIKSYLDKPELRFPGCKFVCAQTPGFKNWFGEGEWCQNGVGKSMCQTFYFEWCTHLWVMYASISVDCAWMTTDNKCRLFLMKRFDIMVRRTLKVLLWAIKVDFQGKSPSRVSKRYITVDNLVMFEIDVVHNYWQHDPLWKQSSVMYDL